MRSASVKGPSKPLPPENDDKSVAFARLDNHFGIAHLLDFFRQQGAELLANLGFDSARAAIRDDSFSVQSAKVRARGHVASL